MNQIDLKDRLAVVTGGAQGLGLAIAADLVRNHGGRLDLLRSDEEGTQFCLRLPRDLAGIPLPAEAPAA